MEPYKFINIDNEKWAVPNKKYWDAQNKIKYKILLLNSDIPFFYRNINFENYKGDISKENVKKAIKYSDNCFNSNFEHVHLYLWGGNSTQKTAIACNIGKKAMAKGNSVKFILAGNLIDKLMKNQGFSFHKDIENYINSIKNVDMLIIDDAFTIGKSLMWKSENKNIIISEWDRFLRDIIVGETKVVITSNIQPESIKEYYGDSLFELVDRNFISLQFLDNVKFIRKKKFDNLL